MSVDRGLAPTSFDREVVDSTELPVQPSGWEDPEHGFDPVFGVYHSLEYPDQQYDGGPPAGDPDRPADVARGIQEYARGADKPTYNVNAKRPDRFICRAYLITVGDAPLELLPLDPSRMRATITVNVLAGTPVVLVSDEAVSISARNPVMSALASGVPYVFMAGGQLFAQLSGAALENAWVNVIIER